MKNGVGFVTAMCIAAANYLIEKTNEYNEGRSFRQQIPMSGKRLQKLLYFSDVWYMQQHGKSMLSDEFFAWPSGPVIPSVYATFCNYQDGRMLPVDEKGHTPLTEDQRRALDRIFAATEQIDTVDLVNASHIRFGPWDSVYKNDGEYRQIVSKESMRSFYGKRPLEDILQIR